MVLLGIRTDSTDPTDRSDQNYVPVRAPPPQQRLYFLPLPQGQGSLRPAWRTEALTSAARTISISFSPGSPAST
jgi:hypothetical protein